MIATVPIKYPPPRRPKSCLVEYEAVLRAVSAACIPEREILSLRAGPGSTVPLEFINYETEYGTEGTGELVCHVRGAADDLNTASLALTNAGIRNMQILAVAVNAAILPPHLQIAYEPRPGGRFIALQALGDDPQAARRMLDMECTSRLLKAFDGHPRELRLLRAAENYGESLRRTHPVSSIQAALHLWMAVESLTVVVRDRLFREYETPRLADLGVALGVEPRLGQAEPDDRDVQGAIRRREVFDGDEATYRSLREASDGIEHGYMSFGDARELVERIFDPAAASVRRSILRESGLAREDIEALSTGVFTSPLPLWRPRVVAEGSFSEDDSFDFARPVHLRVEGAIKVEEIAPELHATTASVDAQVRAFDGLMHSLESVGLDAPGELKAPSSDE